MPKEDSKIREAMGRAARMADTLVDQADERDVLHPGADALPQPARGELLHASTRWTRNAQFCTEGPLITVIIPLYNHQNDVRRCLESVLGQTYAHIEVIIVDDGSTDESLAVAGWLTRKDDRVRIVHKSNGGVSSARNVALARARGEWLYFCDADDWLEPDCIETLWHAVSAGCDMAISDFYRVRGDRYEAWRQGISGQYSLSAFVSRMTESPANFYYGALWNKIFRRSTIESVNLQFDEQVDFGEDHLFILSYLSRCSSIAVIDRPLYYYFDNPAGLTSDAMNLRGIAKNKTTVVEYYLALCSQCGLTQGTDELKRAAGFLFAYATDSVVTPLGKVLRADQLPC